MVKSPTPRSRRRDLPFSKEHGIWIVRNFDTITLPHIQAYLLFKPANHKVPSPNAFLRVFQRFDLTGGVTNQDIQLRFHTQKLQLDGGILHCKPIRKSDNSITRSWHQYYFIWPEVRGSATCCQWWWRQDGASVPMTDVITFVKEKSGRNLWSRYSPYQNIFEILYWGFADAEV